MSKPLLDRARQYRATLVKRHRVADLIDELAGEIEALRASLKECADDLEWEIAHNYEGTEQYPSMRRKRERDMAPVDRARKLLAS